MTSRNVPDRAAILDLVPNDVSTTTANSTGVDLLPYEGKMLCTLDAEAGGSGITYAVKLQDSADNSSFDDLSGVNFSTTAANTA